MNTVVRWMVPGKSICIGSAEGVLPLAMDEEIEIEGLVYAVDGPTTRALRYEGWKDPRGRNIVVYEQPMRRVR